MTTIKNPIVPGWYADPEARIYEGQYWVYVTRSFTEFEKQMNIDAFSSTNLVTWEKHEGIIAMEDFSWIWQAVWAPTIIERDAKYYLIFASNCIVEDSQVGGLEIAVSDRPHGPFRSHLGRSLVGQFIHGAQPIDAHLFKDDDGTVYLYYGGHGHCNVARMNEEMTGFLPFETGETFVSITPQGYVEGPCMLKKDGLYYLMWSLGNWVDGTYRVAYGVSESPLGPFLNKGIILERQESVAEGPGHHGYLYLEDTDEWLIVYHRRYIGDPEPGNRVLCIDRLMICDGVIEPVKMTLEWES